jgi:hypothetical protein
MKLDAQCEPELLRALGAEAVGLLCRGDIGTLANRFGYALSHDRDTATAIRADLTHCLSQVGARALAPTPRDPVRSVRFSRWVSCTSGLSGGSARGATSPPSCGSLSPSGAPAKQGAEAFISGPTPECYSCLSQLCSSSCKPSSVSRH